MPSGPAYHGSEEEENLLAQAASRLDPGSSRESDCRSCASKPPLRGCCPDRLPAQAHRPNSTDLSRTPRGPTGAIAPSLGPHSDWDVLAGAAEQLLGSGTVNLIGLHRLCEILNDEDHQNDPLSLVVREKEVSVVPRLMVNMSAGSVSWSDVVALCHQAWRSAMAPEWSRQTNEGSFSGSLVHDRIVLEGRFMKRFAAHPWEPLRKQLVRHYEAGALYGPLPDEPVPILKLSLPWHLFLIAQ